MEWWNDGAGLPGGVLPVNPSTFRDCKHLQKFDPSGYPSAAVTDPSGIYPPLLPQRFWRWLTCGFCYKRLSPHIKSQWPPSAVSFSLDDPTRGEQLSHEFFLSSCFIVSAVAGR